MNKYQIFLKITKQLTLKYLILLFQDLTQLVVQDLYVVNHSWEQYLSFKISKLVKKKKKKNKRSIKQKLLKNHKMINHKKVNPNKK